MKPMGLKNKQIPNAKHHPKSNGKHIAGWWENIVDICKKRARREAKQQIEQEIE